MKRGKAKKKSKECEEIKRRPQTVAKDYLLQVNRVWWGREFPAQIKYKIIPNTA